MRHVVGTLADRLLSLLVPRSTAAACLCQPGGKQWIYFRGFCCYCALACNCNVIIGTCSRCRHPGPC